METASICSGKACALRKIAVDGRYHTRHRRELNSARFSEIRAKKGKRGHIGKGLPTLVGVK